MFFEERIGNSWAEFFLRIGFHRRKNSSSKFCNAFFLLNMKILYIKLNIYMWQRKHFFAWCLFFNTIKTPLHMRILKIIHEEFCILVEFFPHSTCISIKKMIGEFIKILLGVSPFYCFEFFNKVHKIKSIWFYEPCWRIRNNRMT